MLNNIYIKVLPQKRVADQNKTSYKLEGPIIKTSIVQATN
jgi:hypothetical protein